MGCTRRWRHASGTVTAASPRVSGLSPPGGRPRGGSLRMPVDVTPVEAHTESLRVCPRVWCTPSCGGAACGRGPVPPPLRCRRVGGCHGGGVKGTQAWSRCKTHSAGNCFLFYLFLGGFFWQALNRRKRLLRPLGLPLSLAWPYWGPPVYPFFTCLLLFEGSGANMLRALPVRSVRNDSAFPELTVWR